MHACTQDVHEKACFTHPKLYIPGQKNINFNFPIFVRSLVKGIYVAFVIFFVLLGIIAFNTYPEGYEWDYQSLGVTASASLVIIVNFEVCVLYNHFYLYK